MRIEAGAIVFAVLLAGLAAMLAAMPAGASEREMADKLCAGMEREVPTGGRSRVDCADDTRAIEIDFSQHWAASLGQALYYGRVLERRPTVVLICDDIPAGDSLALDGPFAAKCREHAFRASFGARGAADVLLCAEAAETLDDCQGAGE